MMHSLTHARDHHPPARPPSAGYPKSGLMGFCDPSPAATKALLVLYTWKVREQRGGAGAEGRAAGLGCSHGSCKMARLAAAHL